MSIDELKPCPMLGKKAYLIKKGRNFEGNDLFHVICHKSGIRTKNYTDPKEAIKAWNARSTDKATQEALRVALDALEFYADHSENWCKDLETRQANITNDQGTKASEAITKIQDVIGDPLAEISKTAQENGEYDPPFDNPLEKDVIGGGE